MMWKYSRKKLFFVTLLCMTLLLLLGCWLMSSGQFIGVLQYVLPVLSIIMAWLLVSLPGRFVNHSGILVTFFLLLMMFGIYVYADDVAAMQDTSPIVSVLYPIDSSLSAFFPSRGDFALDNANNGSAYTWPYFLFHYLAYFFFAWVGFSLFGRKLLNRTSLSFIPYNHRNLIWGYSEGGFELAKDIVHNTNGDEPVFLLDEGKAMESAEEKNLSDKLSDENIIAINVSYGRLSTSASDFDVSRISWRKLMRTGKYFGGYRHFFITENQDLNVKMALTVLEQLKLNVKHLSTVTHLYVRTEQPEIDAFFQQELDSDDMLKKMVEIHIFNQSDLTARRFIGLKPILSLADRPDFFSGQKLLDINHEECTVTGQVNILFLGLGWTGFEMLNKMVCDAQFTGDFKLNIVVIDRDYAHKHGRYQYIVKEAAQHNVTICINPKVWLNERHEIECQSLDGTIPDVNAEWTECPVDMVDSHLFYQWLDYRNNVLRFNRVIVALGSDEQNINTALQLHRFRLNYLTAEAANDASKMPEPIFAHVRDRESYEYYKTDKSPIATFGSMSGIYTVDVLINETMDLIAKMVNFVYTKYGVKLVTEDKIREAFRTGEMDELWSGCSLFDQDSSRAVAVNINNLMTIAGGQTEFERRLGDAHFINRLGEMEHLRWNAFHYMRGVRPWAYDEVTMVKVGQSEKRNGKLIFGGGKTLVRHVCLVPYAELDEVSAAVNKLKGSNSEDFKSTDCRIITHFPIFNKVRIYLAAKQQSTTSI